MLAHRQWRGKGGAVPDTVTDAKGSGWLVCPPVRCKMPQVLVRMGMYLYICMRELVGGLSQCNAAAISKDSLTAERGQCVYRHKRHSLEQQRSILVLCCLGEYRH